MEDLSQFDYVRKNHPFNAKLLVVDGALFRIFLTAMYPFTILPGFANKFTEGLDEGYRSLIANSFPVMFFAGIALFQPVGAHMIHAKPYKKTMLMWGLVWQRAPLVFIAILPFFAAAKPSRNEGAWKILALFALAYFAFVVVTSFVVPMWQTMAAKIMDPAHRGKVFAGRMFFGSLLALITSFVVQRVFAPGSVPFPYNYGIVFVIGVVGFLLCIVPLIFLKEKPLGENTDPIPLGRYLLGIGEVLVHDKGYRNFIIGQMFFATIFLVIGAFTTYAQTTYFPLLDSTEANGAANDSLRSGYDNYIAWATIVMTFVSIGPGYFLGRLADRISALQVHRLFSIASPLACLLAAIAPNRFVYLGVFALQGMMLSALYSYLPIVAMEFSTEKNREKYFALLETTRAPVIVLSWLAGGYLVNRHGYETTFLVAASLSFIGCIFLQLSRNERASAPS
ncbi:MAG: MFS transporter [Planctomycetes bacterium]|nr:MFS transporter [Planctomycetota bacterium]